MIEQMTVERCPKCHGSMEVKSKWGDGTTITVRLPVSGAEGADENPSDVPCGSEQGDSA